MKMELLSNWLIALFARIEINVEFYIKDDTGHGQKLE
jgi:hypothetical protein